MNQVPDSSSPVADSLFARARAGDQAAWFELVETCSPKLRRIIRRRLDPPMRSLYDSTDFANDVFKSLAAKSDRFDFPTFEALLAHLAKAAEQKVVDEYRRQHAQKRDIGLNRRLGDDELGPTDLPSAEPTPSQVAVANETHDQLLEGQPDRMRMVIELKRLGYTNDEIADRTGLPIHKVQRIFRGLNARRQVPGGYR